MEPYLWNSRKRIPPFPIQNWVRSLLFPRPTRKPRNVFRLDWECWTKFRRSDGPVRPFSCSSVWISNYFHSVAGHLCRFPITLIDGHSYSLALTHLLSSVWLCQCGSLHSWNTDLWSLLSGGSTSTTYSSDVYHLYWISRRLPYHECIRILLDRGERLASDEATCGDDWTASHLCTRSLLHHQMLTERLARSSLLLQHIDSWYATENLLFEGNHLLDDRHFLGDVRRE